MNWFKKSLPVNHENPHKQQKHKRVKKTPYTKLTKSHSLPLPNSEDLPIHLQQKALSISCCHNIEVVDPEIFFQDPDHVRNYKEEELFLKIMSEWEIIENPSALMGNYFSADFEEEFLQMKTQQQTEINCCSLSSSSQDEAAISQTLQQHESNDNGLKSKNISTTSRNISSRKRSYKRSLTELFFADKIEIGLVPPMMTSSTTSITSPKATPISSQQCSPNLSKKRRRLKPNDILVSQSLLNPPTCSVGIIKDCAIDRSQLKTEALACSIMGAIGKCPAKDKTPRSSIKDLIEESGDFCHPVNSCDHYDIKQFFRLDDNGNILLNMSHIEEIKGFGYASAENKRLYKSYLGEGYTAEEDSLCTHKCCMEILKRVLNVMWNNLKCKLDFVQKCGNERRGMIHILKGFL